MPFASTGGLLADSASFLWDNTLGRLTATNIISTNSTSTNATTTSLYAGGQTILAATSGNVGIGITNPVAADGSSKTLQIGNTVAIQNVVGTQALYGNNVHYDGSWKYITSSEAAAMRIYSGDVVFHTGLSGPAGGTVSGWDSTGVKMIIKNGGNVGIGTNNPATLLDVAGVTTFRGNIIAGTDNTYDIGASGATRPRTGYFGTSVVTPAATISGVLNLSGVNQIHQLSGHNFVQGDAATTYFYGGTSGVQFRKSDNSVALMTLSDTGNLSLVSGATITSAATTIGINQTTFSTAGQVSLVSGILHQIAGHNFVQGDSTNTYLYGGTSGLHFRSADNSTALIDISNTGNLTFATDNTQDIGASSATRPRSVYVGTSLSLGTNPASTGVLRLPNNQSVYARNAANGADQALFNFNSSDQLIIEPTTTIFNATGARVGITSSTGIFTVGNGSYTAFNSGEIGLSNNKYYAALNAAGNNTLGLIKGNASDVVEIGGANTTGVQLNKNTSITGNLTVSGNSTTTNATTTNSYFSNTLTGPGSFTVNSSGDVGIGTSAPVSSLHVNKSNVGQTALLTLSNLNGATNDTADINFSLGGSTVTTARVSAIRTAAGAVTDLAFSSFDGASLVERMRILSGGNVGIGTTAPAAKLDVVGGTRQLSGSPSTPASGKGLEMYYDSGSFAQGEGSYLISYDRTGSAYKPLNFDGSVVRLINSGATAVTVTGGSVGIGTTNPASKLDISGGLILTTGTAASIATKGLQIRFDNTNNTGHISASHSGVANYPLYLGGDGFTGSALYIDAVGNVGINTASPVTYGSFAVRRAVTGIISGYGVSGSFSDAANATVNIVTGTGSLGGVFTDQNLVLGAGNAEKIRVLSSNGNVGIGTTNPASKLDVNGGIRATLDATGANTGQIVTMKSDGTLTTDSTTLTWDSSNDLLSVNGLSIYSTGIRAAGSNNLSLGSANTFPSITVLGTTGAVGIGTTNPSYPLQVSAARSASTDMYALQATGSGATGDQINILFRQNTGADASIYTLASISSVNESSGGASGALAFSTRTSGSTFTEKMRISSGGNLSVTALTSCGGIQTNGSGTMSCTSDQRLKDVQSSFTTGLDAIMGITPQTYSWKADSGLYDGGLLYSGFIAQNIQANIPEAVNTNAKGYLQVNTTSILAASINAIKELNTKVEAHYTELTNISVELQGQAARIGVLESKVANIEAQLGGISTSTASSTEGLAPGFLDGIWDALVSRLASAANGIGDFFANRVKTRELCIADDNGETCITKAALDALLAGVGQSGSVSGGGGDEGVIEEGDGGVEEGGEVVEGGSGGEEGGEVIPEEGTGGDVPTGGEEEPAP